MATDASPKKTRFIKWRLLSVAAWGWLVAFIPSATDAGYVIPEVVGFFLVGGILLSIWWVLKTQKSSSELPSRATIFLAAPLSLLLALFLVVSPKIGLMVRLALCRTTLQEFASQVADEKKLLTPAERVGLFYVYQTETIDGVVFLYTERTRRYGVALNPKRARPRPAKYRMSQLNDDWYVFMVRAERHVREIEERELERKNRPE